MNVISEEIWQLYLQEENEYVKPLLLMAYRNSLEVYAAIEIIRKKSKEAENES